MGKFDFQFDERLVRQLERMANYDKIAPRILGEAIPVLERKVREGISTHKRTGALAKSIKAGKPLKNKYGWYASVFPTGEDERGVKNAEKLIYMEYGTSKQPATPVMTKAINDATPEVTEKMQQIYNEAVNSE
jgi:HK97 gp10 family phage protein